MANVDPSPDVLESMAQTTAEVVQATSSASAASASASETLTLMEAAKVLESCMELSKEAETWRF